jgi:hypothetical protein
MTLSCDKQNNNRVVINFPIKNYPRDISLKDDKIVAS